MAAAPEGPPAVLSVDVEDYYHVEAFSDIVPRERWESYSSRVEDNTRRLLDSLEEEARLHPLGRSKPPASFWVG